MQHLLCRATFEVAAEQAEEVPTLKRLRQTVDEVQAMPERYRVIEAHDPEFPEPWTVRKGERLRFERRETESRGWIWCTDDAGEARWVPQNWVEIEGDSCVMKRDYNSTELALDVGEVLTVEFEESGWAWAGRRAAT